MCALFPEVLVPRVEMAVEVHQGHRPELVTNCLPYVKKEEAEMHTERHNVQKLNAVWGSVNFIRGVHRKRKQITIIIVLCFASLCAPGAPL